MTPVIFKKENGDVFAAFPTLPGDMSPATMTCYAHIGQHSAAHMRYVSNAKPAKPAEYAELLRELVEIGYDDLVIVRRMTRAHYNARKAELQS